MGGRTHSGSSLRPERGPARWATLLTIPLLVSVVLAAAPAHFSNSPRWFEPVSTHAPSRPASLGAVGAVERPIAPLGEPRTAAAFTLSTAGMSPTALALSWVEEDPLGFANYTIERSPNGSAGSWTSATVLTTATTTSFTETQLAPSSTQWWEVVQNGGIFGGETSTVVEVTQPAGSVLSFTNPTSTSVEFNWTNNATYGTGIIFGSYGVFEQIDGSAPSESVVITAVGTTTFTIQGLSPGSSYEFYVNTSDCVDACGSAPVYAVTQSNVVTFGTPLPLVASVSAERATIDTGQSDLISCSPSGGESPFSFAWDLGNGTFVPAGPTVSVSYPTPGPDVITCRLTDHAGTVATGSTGVTVDAPPALQVGTNRSAADVGQSISYTCTSTNGTEPILLTWNFGDGVQMSGGLVSHEYSAAGSFLASCNAVDGTGTLVQASTTETISPDVVVLAAVSSAAAAPGTSLTFSATPMNGSGAFTNFTWALGDGAVGYLATLHHSYVVPSTYTASVMVTDSNGGRASASVSVSIHPILLNLGSEPSTTLVGHSVEYTADPSGGAGAPYNISWTFGDGSIAYGPNVTHAFAASGTYLASVVVTDSLGANSTAALPEITVSTPPVPGPWFTTLDALALLLLVVLIIGIALVVIRRRRTEAALDRVQGRIPPTDPNEVTRGAKVCRNCGTSNLPLRETCVNCGRPLRRSS
jgi:PKD domain-containing protein/fibronectin type III domain protein